MIFHKALVEDLAQEVFIRLHQGRPGFRGESKYRSFLCQWWLQPVAASTLQRRFPPG